MGNRDLAAAIKILAKFYLTKTSFENLLHKPSVNKESFFQIWKGFLRQTAEGKTKVPIADFWQRFGGLAGKEISPLVGSTKFKVELAGLVKKTYKMIEAPSSR